MAEIKDLMKMCEFHSDCSKCELFEPFDTCGVSLLPDNLDEIVDEWVKEHPVKTYAMDFFEKFPNAPKDDDGIPIPCMKYIYADKQFKECLESKVDCLKCWNQEMKENA